MHSRPGQSAARGGPADRGLRHQGPPALNREPDGPAAAAEAARWGALLICPHRDRQEKALLGGRARTTAARCLRWGRGAQPWLAGRVSRGEPRSTAPSMRLGLVPALRALDEGVARARVAAAHTVSCMRSRVGPRTVSERSVPEPWSPF